MKSDRLLWALVLGLIVMAKRKQAASLPLGDFSEPGDDEATTELVDVLEALA